MSKIIILDKEIIRISPKNACHIGYSYNKGRNWLARYIGTSVGEFIDLQTAGGEIIAQCQKGTFYSKDQGRTWLKRS